MELPIPKTVKELWDAWNLRGGVLLSLGLQIFLWLSASRRQRSKNSVLLGLIWLAYLVADWAAAVAIGLITKSQGGGDSCDRDDHNGDLLAFWASFLLVHLGGPDSITSFALEDNEFWLRHLVGLVLQVLLAAYSLFLTLPRNKLLASTALVLVVGTVKFAERTCALYLASSDHFAETVLPEPNPGIDYEQAVEVYSTMRAVKVPTYPEKSSNCYPKEAIFLNMDGNRPISEKDEVELMVEAHSNFERFKGLIVGFLLSSKDRELSRESFLNRSPNEAFRLIEYELSFVYQVLHTKVVVVRRRVGYALRAAVFFSMLAASAMFYRVDKAKMAHSDVALTYALLAGAVSLEASSIFNLVFSKWTWISVKDTRWRKLIASKVLALRGLSGWSGWSRSISQYNAIDYCLHERPAWLYKLASCLCIKAILDQLKIWFYSDSATISSNLETIVLSELKAKSLAASSLRLAAEACSQRGDWALLRISNYEDLKWSIGEFQYAESLLVWHIATELCFTDDETQDALVCEKKLVCKAVSDYMFWLLVSKPAMLAPVLGNWHIAFQDTCAEAKRFFAKHRVRSPAEACRRIRVAGSRSVRPAAVKGNMSKSVLFDASCLANKLGSLEINYKWSLMSRVWVELLSYAAINCRAIVHAQQPSKGGELLTFVWLLMNHLGLGTQFYEQQQAGTKMVPRK